MSGDSLADAPAHEFEPYREGSKWCGFKWDGLSCGYDRAAHLNEWFRRAVENHQDRASQPTEGNPGNGTVRR